MRKVTEAIFALIIFAGIIWYFFGGGMGVAGEVAGNMQHIQNQAASNNMQQIYDQVALDAVQQYEIAKRGGDKMQTYVQATLVSAAYLQAKDEVNYNKWKAIEKEEAKNAGMPVQ